jgi:hypothetical protein
MWSQLLPWLLLAACVIVVNSAAAVLIFRLSARLRAQASELERAQAQRAELEHERIPALEAELASRARELERQLREVPERPEGAEGPERIREMERQLEAQAALVARVSGLETSLAVRERELGERTTELEAATRAGHELEQRVERQASELAELERKAREREDELRARSETIESLQVEVAEARRGLDERRDDLERERRARTERERELEMRLAERETALSARAAELEGELARREGELRRRSEALESLQREAAEARHTIDVQRVEVEGERQARTERERELEFHLQELEAAFSARAGELEEELRRRSRSSESLEDEVAESRRRLEALSTERDDLAARERASTERERASAECERELGRRLQELQDALSTQVGELEARLAEREDELSRRSETFESLRRELVENRCRVDALSGERDELARQAMAQSERERTLDARMQEIESAMSARIEELEDRLGERDDVLAQRSATIAELQAEIARGASEIETARRRSHELALASQRRLEEEQEHLRVAHERERGLAQRASELEVQLSARDHVLDRLRGECVELAGRCGAFSQRVEAREHDLRDRERSLAGAHARLQELVSEIQLGRDRSEVDQAAIERLVEGRILFLFEPSDSRSPERLPHTYLEGLASGDLEVAVRGLIGGEEPLSAPAMASLCARWRDGYTAWREAPIERQVAYLWADGVRVRAGVAGDRPLLVAIACYADGETSPIALDSGDPAASSAWLAILQGLERRGMNVPRLIVTSEATGVPAALDELGWNSAVQYCWNGRTAAVLAELPKSRHASMSKALRALSVAKTRAKAKELRERFVRRCGKGHAPAGKLVATQWRRMTSFHAFPEEHRPHLCTTELVAAPLARIRLLAAAPEPSPERSLERSLEPGNAGPEVEPILWRLLSLAYGALPPLTPEPIPAGEEPRARGAKRPSLARAA